MRAKEAVQCVRAGRLTALSATFSAVRSQKSSGVGKSGRLCAMLLREWNLTGSSQNNTPKIHARSVLSLARPGCDQRTVQMVATHETTCGGHGQGASHDASPRCRQNYALF